MVPRRMKSRGLKGNYGADDPEGAETVAAPATVSGEPSVISSTTGGPFNRGRLGKVGARRRPASQETCHRKTVFNRATGMSQQTGELLMATFVQTARPTTIAA